MMPPSRGLCWLGRKLGPSIAQRQRELAEPAEHPKANSEASAIPFAQRRKKRPPTLIQCHLQARLPVSRGGRISAT